VDTFEALAEPIRRSILTELVGGERPVGVLVETLGASQPLVSRHLRILRDTHLVSARVDAQRRLYSLADDALVDVDTWLAPYRSFWAERLNALETYLDSATATNRGSSHA
jgi:DNA-binding transcriptional ArsR family regulator